MAKQYNVITACYGGRRGATLATLTQAFLDTMGHDGIEIKVMGRGNEKFIGNKADTPIPSEHIAALEQIAARYDGQTPAVRNAVARLKQTGRKVATATELNQANAVYAVDDFILGKYSSMSGVSPSGKYKTVLQGIGAKHKVYGDNMDDTETTTDFTNRVIVPKLQGKTPESLKPADSKYFGLDGTQYRAGDAAAKLHEADDLVKVSYGLAQRIMRDAGTSSTKTDVAADVAPSQVETPCGGSNIALIASALCSALLYAMII